MGSISDAKTTLDKIKEIDRLLIELQELKTSLLELDSLDVPYVPSTMIRVDTMIRMACPSEGMKIVDLGSGDGRILIAFAKAGAYATGYELSKSRIHLSLSNIRAQHLEERVKIVQKNFFEADLSQYDIITLYGLGSLMEKIESKITKEALPGTKILSNYFQFPNLKPQMQENKVYLYIK